MAVWRITERSAFAALRRAGRRSRRGPIVVTYLPPDADRGALPSRVAYAVGRAVGSAVVRNRVRRRLRAIVATLDLPPGDYLIRADASAATAPFSVLEQSLTVAVDTVHR
jgi:ribonuclease P protein component